MAKSLARKKKSTPLPPVWVLRLYIAGETLTSVRAIANLKKICSEHLKSDYKIEIIDLIKQPHLAKGDQIFATPTLIRHLPKPIRQIIGDLSNTEKVLAGLEIQ